MNDERPRPIYVLFGAILLGSAAGLLASHLGFKDDGAGEIAALTALGIWCLRVA